MNPDDPVMLVNATRFPTTSSSVCRSSLSMTVQTVAGGYKGALELLLNGKVDVAFGSDIAPEKYLEPKDVAKLRPVAKIGPVPSHVFVASPDLPDSTVKSLTDALVDLNKAK